MKMPTLLPAAEQPTAVVRTLFSPSHKCFPIILVIVAMLTLSTRSLRAEITLPLQGYCHTGRYMPVYTDSGDVELQTEGSIPTVVHAGSPSIVPVLIGPMSNRLTIGPTKASFELHPLADNERLVGVCPGATNDYALLLFNSGHVLPIPLQAGDPLAGPPAAWQALDGVVLTPAALATLDDLRRSALLAEGITLAVDTNEKPNDGWPWIRRGPLWILATRPIGPLNSLVNPDAFAPLFAIPTGLSPRDRRTFAAVTCLLAGLLILARFVRWPVRYLLGVAVVTIAFALLWRHTRPPVRSGQGIIFVQHPDALQRRDTWLFEIGRSESIHSIPWSGFTRPVLPSESSIADSHLRLVCDAAMRFEYQTFPGRAVAFVKTDIDLEPAGPPGGGVSPLELLANTLYVQPGVSIAGTSPADRGWASVRMIDQR